MMNPSRATWMISSLTLISNYFTSIDPWGAKYINAPSSSFFIMEVFTKVEVRRRYAEIIEKIKQGVVFIHPSDTIYGLGGNALDTNAVTKIRNLKHQSSQPFSVWVPSLAWVRQHCVINLEAEQWLQKLPGPYTLVMKLKHATAVAGSVTVGGTTLGLRFPDHWFGKIIAEVGLPIVTTSANKTGQSFMTMLDNLDPEIQNGVEFMIYEGEKKSRPSTIINLVEGTVKER